MVTLNRSRTCCTTHDPIEDTKILTSTPERGTRGLTSSYLSDNICQTIDIRPILCYTRGSLVRQLDFLLMSTLLIKNATILVTMDDRRREISDGGLFVRDGFIEQVGPTGELASQADEVLDLSGHLVLPGLVNTHHHFYQTLTRVVPACTGCQPVQLAQDALSHLGTPDAG